MSERLWKSPPLSNEIDSSKLALALRRAKVCEEEARPVFAERIEETVRVFLKNVVPETGKKPEKLKT